VARVIGDAWLRAIENTLERLPPKHQLVVQRVVIDDRPTEHGIGPFDRRAADDARDGRTLWLHQRLFVDKNHWAQGNFGAYWSYHANEDGIAIHGQPADHALFSPVLLHEIGHLVGYSLINGDPALQEAPPCAHMCGDRPGGCKGLDDKRREESCASPYCMPFKFQTGTENWAEQYRLFFQSKATRDTLSRQRDTCSATLDKLTEGQAAPWERGLPDIGHYRKSRWKSCGDKPCKPL
jgi:hypothetical protein